MKWELVVLVGSIVLGVAFLCRDPKCPRCGWRMWQKGMWPQWCCRWCNLYFNPLTKESQRS